MSNRRPGFVPRDFAGGCKIFPATNALFLPFQQRWIDETAVRSIAEKSRQIGWTWMTAFKIVSRMSVAGAKNDTWISSRDEVQARLFIDDCKEHARLFQTLATDLGEQVVDDKGTTAFVLQFANGLKIYSLSSNPDAQAGKRGDRVLDEFALHKDPRKLYAIALPGTTWASARVMIFSTHRGRANFLNDLIGEVREKGNPKGFALHRVTLADALDQGLLYKLQRTFDEGDPRLAMDEAEYFDFTRAGCADVETFEQEYMCVPEDEDSNFLTMELIRGCCYPASEDWSRLPAQLAQAGNPLHVGVDVGRDHDLTSIIVLELVGGVHFTRAMIDLQNSPFDAQEAELYRWLELPNVARCCIDRNGLGRQFTERAQQRFGEYKVEGVAFTGGSKEDMAYPLRAAFEDRSLRIPDRRELLADLRGVRKETTASGNIRFAGERGKNGHCDRFWALALALLAGRNPGWTFAPIPVEPGGEAWERKGERSVYAS